MKYKTLLIFFVLLFTFHLPPSFAQTTTEQLESELAEAEGSDYCEKALLLSDLYFANKDFEKAMEYSSLAYEQASSIGRRDLMATALTKQAKAKIRNKKLRKKERLGAIKHLGKSLEMITKHGIDNLDLEQENIEIIVDASKEFIKDADDEEIEEILVVTFDSIKHGLSRIPAIDYRFEFEPFEREAPKAAVPEHILKKRQRQQEYQQKIMEMNFAKMENQVKKANAAITDKAPPEEYTFRVIDDLVALPELKKQWMPQKEELEKEFTNEARRIERMNAREAREELLLAEYKNKFDSLNHRHTVDSINLEKNKIALQQQEAEVARQKTHRSLMMVGSGGSVVLSLLFLFGFLQQRKNNRLLSEKNMTIQHEQERSQELLLNILPAEVASELKEYGSAKAHQYDEVTVLFSDFKNFTKIAEKLSPEKLIADLDFCFKAFDGITEKYQLEKIKTIGDAYLCAGGIPSPHPEHAERSINAAKEMQQFLEKWKKEKIEKGELFFEARIGIHTGPLIAGVVGIKKFAYDIWGDTVNIASRMESHGQVGKVNISEKTYELVKDQFDFVDRGKIAIKNKGEINMYFVS
ncbi:MAG: adenylate/guanylate cyclase domain-containing protein [Bacteroidota bacterium]